MSLFSDMAGHGVTALIRSHGTACQLPNCTTDGLFDPVGDMPSPWASEVGLQVRVSQQASPYVLLRPSAAASLEVADLLHIEAADYRVTAIDTPRHGLAVVRLTPVTTDQAAGSRWR